MKKDLSNRSSCLSLRLMPQCQILHGEGTLRLKSRDHPDEPLLDPISADGEITRVHLRPYRKAGLDPERLTPAELTDYFDLRAAARFPAVRHSEEYRRAYSSSYRVIRDEALRSAGVTSASGSGTRRHVSDITRLLQRMESGDPDAPAELLSLVYTELHALAARKMARERPGQTIQATVLVHEAWYRLGGNQQPRWQNRAHFFAAVAEAMRRILIENARRKDRLKRGGQLDRVDVSEVEIVSPLPDDQLLALDEALDRLALEDPRAAEIVKLCFFVGFTQQEAAEQLGVSVSTVERTWAYARAWLFREIRRGPDPSS